MVDKALKTISKAEKALEKIHWAGTGFELSLTISSYFIILNKL